MKIETADIFTLANATSATGAVFAIHGATRLDTPAGLAETAFGRLLDVADGPIARATRTSELGAAVDGTLDKLACAAIVGSEWQKNMAPKVSLGAIVLQNVANAAATAVAARRHPDVQLDPTKDGKYAMALQNLALAAYAGAANLERRPTASRLLKGLGHVATAVGVGYFGIKATTQYVRRAY